MPILSSFAAWHRLLAVAVLGFASGLPLALTGQAMQAWLTVEGLDLATIGFLSLVGLPYTFKFLWAPLMDRFELPGWWRRRGWLVATQLAMAAALWAIAAAGPKESIRVFALLAVVAAFVSASQDVVVDAYRTELLPASERGLGASLGVMGYRLAMIVSGGLTLIWTDVAQGGGWSWAEVYRWMAWLMVGAAAFSAVALPASPAAHGATPASAPPPAATPASTPASTPPSAGASTTAPAMAPAPVTARRDLLGFAAVVLAVVAGVVLTDRVLTPIAQATLGPLLTDSALTEALRRRWVDLAALLVGIAITLPLGWWVAKTARYDTLVRGLRSYFGQHGAVGFLVLIVLYKLGDAFAGALMTPFLLKGLAYSSAEVGVVNKLIGLWLTIGGALLGGALMLKLGLWRALFAFAVLQLISNLGFWWLAVGGKGSLGQVVLPAFDWGFVKLAAPTPVDGGLLMVVAGENLAGGMGTAALLAFMMALCNQRFTATQFALLSAFASVGRVWVGPMAGVLAASIGWPTFFVISTVLALPALGVLWWLRGPVSALDRPPAVVAT